MTTLLRELGTRLLLIDNPIVVALSRVIGLLIVTGGGLWLAYSLILNGNGSGTSIALALIVAICIVGTNVIFLRSSLYPLRWFVPGLVLMALMVLYPVGFTSYIAFTNFGTGNLLNREQTVNIFESQVYLPEEGGAFTWTAFLAEKSDDSEENSFLLWLQAPDGSGFLAAPGADVLLGDVDAGPLDSDGIPVQIPGYERLERGQTLRYLRDLNEVAYGSSENESYVRDLDTAAQVEPQYIYDQDAQTLTNQETGVVYEPLDGRFTNADGEELTPGYYVTIGTQNFQRLFDPANPQYRGPFIRIFIWTFVFAVLVVVTTFGLGLALAIVFNDPTLPGRKLIQSAMVIPYAMPAFISVQIWKGLLNPEFGVVSQWLVRVFGDSPSWFADPIAARFGVLLVTLWLGFPYMFLICSGALQSIPTNIYEAAEIDGAGGWARFVNITLPLLLVAVGPLLIASFAFNFNNFTVIDIYNEGGPPIVDSATQAGHTDILITYVFRLAFAGGRGIDYGYASAITIVIFFILATMVAYQFRYTRVWEEISENV